MNCSTESQAGSVPPSDTQTEETGPTAASDQTAPPPATTEAPTPAPASPVKRSKSKLKEKKQVVRDITLNNFSTHSLKCLEYGLFFSKRGLCE